MEATGLWLIWQALLAPYAPCFHDPRGFRRFVEWITGLALNVEEHTITQSLVGLDREQDWHALEAFAEYAAFDTRELERFTARVLEDAPGRLWYGFHVWAGDAQVRFWNADNGGNTRNFGGNTDFLYAVAVSPDGSVVAAGGEEGIVRLYNGTSGALIKALLPPGVEAPKK